MLTDAEARSSDMVRQAELMATTHMESELRALNERKAALNTEVEQLNERIVAERERVAAVIESLQRLLRSPEGLGTLSYRPAPVAAAAPVARVTTESLLDDHALAAPSNPPAAEQEPGLRLPDSAATGEVPLVDPWRTV